jgi:hypothetical protein
VKRSNLQTTNSGKAKHTGEHFSLYHCDNLRAKIETPSCWQYKPGEFMADRPLNWDEIIDENDDNENWVDIGALSGGSRRPGDGNENDNGEGEEDMEGGGKGTGKGKGTKDTKGKGMRRGREMVK